MISHDSKSKRRKKPKPKKGMKNTVRSAMSDIDKLRDLATDHSLTVRVSEIRCRRGVVSYHFMFEDTKGECVLDYWPGSGRTWCRATREKGKFKDCWLALDEAARISAGVPK